MTLPAGVRVDFENPAEVERFLIKQSKGLSVVANDSIVDVTLKADSIAKEHARDPGRPPKPDTRRYLNSIHPIIKKTGGGAALTDGGIASNDQKALWFEKGTKPHVIRPSKNVVSGVGPVKPKQALFWPGAAHPVKKVNHPGTPAYKVLGKAVVRALKKLNGFVQANLKKWYSNAR